MTAIAPQTTTDSRSSACPNVWLWQGHRICYQAAGDTGPAVVLIHGFGASWRHWRKNIPI
ncbi:MAG TPA: hypothetical protein V6D46_04550 [Coleofasciculaceae cyanobacterium]